MAAEDRQIMMTLCKAQDGKNKHHEVRKLTTRSNILSDEFSYLTLQVEKTSGVNGRLQDEIDVLRPRLSYAEGEPLEKFNTPRGDETKKVPGMSFEPSPQPEGCVQSHAAGSRGDGQKSPEPGKV